MEIYLASLLLELGSIYCNQTWGQALAALQMDPQTTVIYLCDWSLCPSRSPTLSNCTDHWEVLPLMSASIFHPSVLILLPGATWNKPWVDLPLTIWKWLSFLAFPRSPVCIPLAPTAPSLFGCPKINEMAWRHPLLSLHLPTEPSPLCLLSLRCTVHGPARMHSRVGWSPPPPREQGENPQTMGLTLLVLWSLSFRFNLCSASFPWSSIVIVPESFPLKHVVVFSNCAHTAFPAQRNYKIPYFLISKGKSKNELHTFLTFVDLMWLLNFFLLDCPL